MAWRFNYAHPKLMLRELTSYEFAEMIAYERIDRVPESAEEKAEALSKKAQAIFESKGFHRGQDL